MRLILALALLLVPAGAQTNALDFLNHNRPVFDAHNCYPYEGSWADRIERALQTGFPVAIEQDMAWYGGRAVVSHTDKTKGSEPLLRDYFFERVRPIVEKALAENDRARWPLIVVHFDFKSNDAPLLHAVWEVLGEYEGWITTAVKTADPGRLSPFDAKPLLVLTEDSDAQEEVFFRQVPVGGKLRLFGSAHTKAIPSQPKQEHDRLLATLPPAELLASPPSNYRRWWNNSWFEVEEGGQRRAGDWTPADEKRLRALVDYAHKLGYWIRFFTLDGFTPGESKGWDQAYNFGSHEAVLARWKAAIAAGVNLIASDQYEELAPLVHAAR
ncbi:MAG TPA: hypothetical protein VE959_18745 [Bryobacteraceae bacterium]|nr:hypothetical protein [Bryobacteraceae bacterium]